MEKGHYCFKSFLANLLHLKASDITYTVRCLSLSVSDNVDGGEDMTVNTLSTTAYRQRGGTLIKSARGRNVTICIQAFFVHIINGNFDHGSLIYM